MNHGDICFNRVHQTLKYKYRLQMSYFSSPRNLPRVLLDFTGKIQIV